MLEFVDLSVEVLKLCSAKSFSCTSGFGFRVLPHNDTWTLALQFVQAVCSDESCKSYSPAELQSLRFLLKSECHNPSVLHSHYVSTKR